MIDTEDAVLLSLRDVVRDVLQQDKLLDDLRFVLGITSDNALRMLGIRDTDRANALWHRYFQQYSAHIAVFDGIRGALEELTRRACALGILTSKTKAEYQSDFVPFGIAHYFDVAVCADDTVHHKPHCEPMLKFLEYAGADAKNTLYIGDTAHDMKCAQGAGVDFALALWGCKRQEGIQAKHCLSHPREIVGVL